MLPITSGQDRAIGRLCVCVSPRSYNNFPTKIMRFGLDRTTDVKNRFLHFFISTFFYLKKCWKNGIHIL